MCGFLPPLTPGVTISVPGCFHSFDCVTGPSGLRGYISYLYSSALFLELRILPFFIFFEHLRLFPPAHFSVGFPVQPDLAHTFPALLGATPAALRLLARHRHLRLSLVHGGNCLHPLLIFEHMLFCFRDLLSLFWRSTFSRSFRP